MHRRDFMAAGAGILFSSAAGVVSAQHRDKVVVLSAPSNLGLQPPSAGVEPGVRHLPEALRRHGLLSKLHATDAGEIAAPPYDSAKDPISGVRNEASVRRYSIALADRIGPLLGGPSFPLVLGGDCSILIGTSLALRRRRRCGLLFIDGHTDLLTPATSASGGIAGMDLALVTGTGPQSLTAIEGLSPYVQPADVVIFGFRWPASEQESPAYPRPPMRSFPLHEVRDRGIAAAMKAALGGFRDIPFWLHVDADVIDPRWMPAVDSPDPGGLTPEELQTVIGRAVGARNCLGMELTIYDPTLDPSGAGAELLVNVLSRALGGVDSAVG